MNKNINKIVVATTNQGKLSEIRPLLCDYKIISAVEAGFVDEIEETGTTFMENALLKARTVCKATGLPALGDDAGLCIDALNGEPGLYSSRYSGQGTEANRLLVLKKMQGQNNRAAHFTCAMALVFPDGREYTAEGRTDGVIADHMYSGNGFGYDCLFISDELGKAFSLATLEEKNAVSHRGRALQNLLNELNK